MERYFFKYFLALFCIFFCSLTFANTKEHAKSWNTVLIDGPLSQNGQIRYYLQPQIIFIDNKYRYESGALFFGSGYQFKPNATIWLINLFSVHKQSSGEVRERYTLRQQMNWTEVNTPALNLLTISRFEQRFEMGQTEVGLRLRQNVTFRVPLSIWDKHSIVIFEEVFFALNHPKWLGSDSFFEQNRAFLGLGTWVSKDMILDVGYMNQYEFRHTNEMNNVFFVRLNIWPSHD